MNILIAEKDDVMDLLIRDTLVGIERRHRDMDLIPFTVDLPNVCKYVSRADMLIIDIDYEHGRRLAELAMLDHNIPTLGIMVNDDNKPIESELLRIILKPEFNITNVELMILEFHERYRKLLRRVRSSKTSTRAFTDTRT